MNKLMCRKRAEEPQHTYSCKNYTTGLLDAPYYRLAIMLMLRMGMDGNGRGCEMMWMGIEVGGSGWERVGATPNPGRSIPLRSALAGWL